MPTFSYAHLLHCKMNANRPIQAHLDRFHPVLHKNVHLFVLAYHNLFNMCKLLVHNTTICSESSVKILNFLHFPAFSSICVHFEQGKSFAHLYSAFALQAHFFVKSIVPNLGVPMNYLHFYTKFLHNVHLSVYRTFFEILTRIIRYVNLLFIV